MQQLTKFNPNQIRQYEGLYCLTDLFRISGSDDKHKPHRFLRLDKTKALINALQEHQKITDGKEMGYQQKPILKTVKGGALQGTYGSRKLMYAYANWIDPYFYAVVLEVFDRVASGQTSYTAQINALCSDLNRITDCLSELGKGLCIHGKQTKPEMLKELNTLLEQQQQTLALEVTP